MTCEGLNRGAVRFQGAQLLGEVVLDLAEALVGFVGKAPLADQVPELLCGVQLGARSV